MGQLQKSWVGLSSVHIKTLTTIWVTGILLTCYTVNLQAATQDDTASVGLTSPFVDSSPHDITEIDNDGFTIDDHIADSIVDEQLSREELLIDKAYRDSLNQDRSGTTKTTKAPLFERTCPYGYFACANSECLSPKWRCDGHYDCDDFSDELNCTSIELPPNSDMKLDQVTSKPPPPPPLPSSDELTEIKFNSSQEPLMLFSTGLSIRGYWMRSRIYFDVVSMGTRPARNDGPSITQALSVFFDLLNVDRSPDNSKSTQGVTKARSTIVGIDMDPNDKQVFWVELGKDAGVFSTIIDNDQFEARHRRQFEGPKHKTIVDSGLLSPEDLALDIVGKNLYITDAGLQAIVVCAIKNSQCRMLVRDNLHKPRAIIADSSTGWLTYTDWGDHPGIFLVSMDGKRRETLIDTDVVWPNGLAADYSTNQLYWADARLSKIERIDLASKKRREVIKESAANPFSLSLFENRI